MEPLGTFLKKPFHKLGLVSWLVHNPYMSSGAEMRLSAAYVHVLMKLFHTASFQRYDVPVHITSLHYTLYTT